jgi:hypothetical protein
MIGNGLYCLAKRKNMIGPKIINKLGKIAIQFVTKEHGSYEIKLSPHGLRIS